MYYKGNVGLRCFQKLVQLIIKKVFSKRISVDFECEAAKIESKSIQFIHSRHCITFNIDFPHAVNTQN